VRDPVLFSRPTPKAPLWLSRVAREAWGPRTYAYRGDFPTSSVVVILDGRGGFSAAGRTWDLTMGSVFTFGPGGEHAFWCDHEDPLRLIIMDLRGPEASPLLGDTFSAVCTVIQPPVPHLLFELTETIFSIAKSYVPNAHETCLWAMQGLLSLLRGSRRMEAGNTPPARRRYEQCRRILHQKFVTMQSAAEAAEECGIGQEYMCRLFRRFGQISPQQYLQQLKMRYAQTLLRDNAMSVKQIAAELGYHDPYTFSKLCKRVLGAPPSSFRGQCSAANTLEG
jgi:AraC-like DNA-binding protein